MNENVSNLDKVEDKITKYFDDFCEKFDFFVDDTFQQKGYRIIQKNTWNGNPQALAGGLIRFLIDELGLSKRYISIDAMANILGASSSTIRTYYKRIKEALIGGREKTRTILGRKNRAKNRIKRKGGLLKYFHDFCKAHRAQLPPRFRREGNRLIKGMEIKTDFSGWAGGVVLYLKKQLFYEEFYYKPLSEEDIAGAFSTSSERVTECYRELLDRFGILVIYTEDGVGLDTQTLMERLQLSEADPKYDEEKIALLDAVINSYRLQFGTKDDQYEPEFLRWVYDHPFWDADEMLCHHYLFQYIQDKTNGWPLPSMFFDLLRRRGLLQEDTHAILDRVEKEVSKRFGKLGRIEKFIRDVLLEQGAIEEAKVANYLRIFQKYCNGCCITIPGWKEVDYEFWVEEWETFNKITDRMVAQDFSYLSPGLEWVETPDMVWVRAIEDNRIMTIYYPHSRRIQGTEREWDEFNMIQRQFPVENFVNPAEFDWTRLGIIAGEKRMEYCLEFVRTNVDLLVFSEFQGYIGRGVFLEVQEARKKEIPFFLLRDGKFWMNPEVEIDDPTDWALRYAKVSDLPFEPVYRIKENLEF